MIQEEKDEGITLRSIPYKERSRIITVFFKHFGLTSLLIHGLSKKNSFLLSLSSPFCVGEFVFKKNKGDFFTFKEGKVIDNLFSLRKNFSSISFSTKLSKAILRSQLPQKNWELYSLFKTYLQKMGLFSNKEALYYSFILKMMKKEGFLHLFPTCNICKNIATVISSGESLCQLHATNFSFPFSRKEFLFLLSLLHAKTFSQLENIQLEEKTKEKISHLFDELYS